MTFQHGDIVECVDGSSKPKWAAWYQDKRYCEDMLVRGNLYVVFGTAVRDGEEGVDVNVPTPWGDHYWDASRFKLVERKAYDTSIEAVA